MRKEVGSLKNFQVPGTTLEIEPLAFPTLGQFLALYFICILYVFYKYLCIFKCVFTVDGKVKKTWSGCPHGFWACWICWASRTKLGQDLRGMPDFEPKDLWFAKMGFANVHLVKNAFDHYVKYTLHRDFKSYQCRYVMIDDGYCQLKR